MSPSPIPQADSEILLALIGRFYQSVEQVNTHWHFADDHFRKVLPIHAQLEPSKALTHVASVGSWSKQIICLSEICVALRHMGQRDAIADTALEKALSVERDRRDRLSTSTAAAAAAIACALFRSGQDSEAWLQRAIDNQDNINNPYETVMGVSRYHLHRGDGKASADALNARGYSSHLFAFKTHYVRFFIRELIRLDQTPVALDFGHAIIGGREWNQLLAASLLFAHDLGKQDAVKVLLAEIEYSSRIADDYWKAAAAQMNRSLMGQIVGRGFSPRADDTDHFNKAGRWMLFEPEAAKKRFEETVAVFNEKFPGEPTRMWRSLAAGGATIDLDRAMRMLDAAPSSSADGVYDVLEEMGHNLAAQGNFRGVVAVLKRLEAHSKAFPRKRTYDTPPECIAASILSRSGATVEGLAILERLRKETRDSDKLKTIAETQLAVGGFAAARRTVQQIKSDESHDKALKDVAVAAGRAGRLDVVRDCADRMKIPKERVYGIADGLEAWAENRAPYYSVRTFC
ncbi:MAG: hypothetical protein AAFV53_25060 [Myxococcota bacterium]